MSKTQFINEFFQSLNLRCRNCHAKQRLNTKQIIYPVICLISCPILKRRNSEKIFAVYQYSMRFVNSHPNTANSPLGGAFNRNGNFVGIEDFIQPQNRNNFRTIWFLFQTCRRLGVKRGGASVYHKTNRETMVEIGESIRGKDIYIIKMGTK